MLITVLYVISKRFFDLDGTLSDSSVGEINAVKYELNHFGIFETRQDILTYFIGPPLKESFKKPYNLSDENISIAIFKYREYYLKEGIKKNKVYEGIPELLDSLQAHNIRIYLVTSNPTQFASKMLKLIGVDKYFTGIYGSKMNGDRIRKFEILEFLFKNNPELLKSESVMIGAHLCGIDAISVLYGFGSRDEVYSCNPDYIVNSIDDLQNLLLKST